MAMTKMSQNGQIVIPVEIRRALGFKPQEPIIVLQHGKTALLKRVDSKMLKEELELLEDIRISEEDIEKGRYTKFDPNWSFEEFDAAMRGKKKWKSSSPTASGKRTAKSRIKR